MGNRVEKTRWGDVVYEPGRRPDTEYATFPDEHPQQVCFEAAMMAGTMIDCIDHASRYELFARCIDFDHLPRDRRVRELAVHLVSMAVYDKWENCLFNPTDHGCEETPEEAAERAVIRLEGAQLAAEWKKTERDERRKRRKK